MIFALLNQRIVSSELESKSPAKHAEGKSFIANLGMTAQADGAKKSNTGAPSRFLSFRSILLRMQLYSLFKENSLSGIVSQLGK